MNIFDSYVSICISASDNATEALERVAGVCDKVAEDVSHIGDAMAGLGEAEPEQPLGVAAEPTPDEYEGTPTDDPHPSKCDDNG